MEKFMLIYIDDISNNTCASFYSSYREANNAKTNLLCGLGIDAELYERTENGYELIGS